jgi:FMN-dependent NADH-azoreductase
MVRYLETVLSFLGMTDVHFVYAEGLAMGAAAEDSAIASAYEQIEEAFGARPSKALAA